VISLCVRCKAICVMHNPCVCISQLTLIWNVGMKSILFLLLSCPPFPETSCLPCLGFATCVEGVQALQMICLANAINGLMRVLEIVCRSHVREFLFFSKRSSIYIPNSPSQSSIC
jgi:hypothetical protein